MSAASQPEREDKEILNEISATFGRLSQLLQEAATARIMVDVKLTVEDHESTNRAPRPRFKVRCFKML